MPNIPPHNTISLNFDLTHTKLRYCTVNEKPKKGKVTENMSTEPYPPEYGMLLSWMDLGWRCPENRKGRLF